MPSAQAMPQGDDGGVLADLFHYRLRLGGRRRVGCWAEEGRERGVAFCERVVLLDAPLCLPQRLFGLGGSEVFGERFE
jgi:hypothetical protein